MNFNDMLKKKKKEDSETPENAAEMTNESGQADGQETPEPRKLLKTPYPLRINIKKNYHRLTISFYAYMPSLITSAAVRQKSVRMPAKQRVKM